MKTILCYGDSNTFGYNPTNGMRYPRDVRWPGRLQELLGDEYLVVEEGCNGRTTCFVDTEEPWKDGTPYMMPCLNSHKPVDLVIMMLGSNDLKSYFHASAEDIARGYERLVEIIEEFTLVKQGFQPKIVVVAPPALGPDLLTTSPFGPGFSEESMTKALELPGLYAKIAEQHHCLFVNAQELVEPSALDSLHLTPEGHEKLAETFAEVVKNAARLL